jgi:hypothetical protein
VASDPLTRSFLPPGAVLLAPTGLTLFSPMEGEGMVYLIDLTGKAVHTWKMPYPPGLYGYLTEKGTLSFAKIR